MTTSRTAVLERYFESLRSHDWASLADCLAEDVHRTGPYLDVVEGKRAYVDFLSKKLPTLPNYGLTVARIRTIGESSAVAELKETVDVEGTAKDFPEAIFFDFDADGRILRVDIYVKK